MKDLRDTIAALWIALGVIMGLLVRDCDADLRIARLEAKPAHVCHEVPKCPWQDWEQPEGIEPNAD